MSAEGVAVLILGWIGVLLIDLLRKLLVDELAGWLTSLSESLIESAASRLPVHGDRYREDWLAELAALEGRRISGFRHAVGVFRGSRSLCAALEQSSSVQGAHWTPCTSATPDSARTAQHTSDPAAPSAAVPSRALLRHFSEFYERVSPAVLRYFVGQTADPHHAFDLTAEAFAKAYENRALFRGATQQHAAVWMWAFASEELAKYRRAGKVELAAVGRLGLQPPALSDGEVHRLKRLAGN